MNAGSWQPDPTQRHELRWWDGTQWSGHVSDHGIAGTDPYAASTVAWSPPAVTSPAVTSPASTAVLPSTPPPQRPPGGVVTRKAGVIAAGALAVVALGVGGVLLFGGDDEGKDTVGSAAQPVTTPLATAATTPATATTVAPATTPAPTTVAPTTVPATTVAPTTVAATVAVTTTLPTASAAQLVEAMPQADDVPASWFIASEPNPAPVAASGPGEGFCGGPNAIARAQAAGAATAAGGPSFDITDGGTFAVDAYSFPTVEAAANFMRATEAQVTGCAQPVTYDAPEAEVDMFEDGFGDDALWTFVEHPTATYAVTNEADDLLQVSMDTSASTSAAGDDYSFMIGEQTWYERHGRIMLVFDLTGWWGFSGFGDGSQPDWAFEPTTQAAADAAAVVRTQIVMRLTDMGVM
ncbi:MAG: DUF2510 domain-containing protein [Ilumatobacteraceae bacterium]